jgi:hypothetical protein
VLVGDAEACERRSTKPPASCATACSSGCDPHRADAALPLRPHDRARRRSPRPTAGLIAKANATRAKDDCACIHPHPSPLPQPRRAAARRAAARQAPGLDEPRRAAKAKGLLRAEKAGHTGTLDPLATGLLPLCFGAATKFSQVSLDADKRYRATLHLGQRAHGGDREGEVIDERPVAVDRAALDAAVRALHRPIDQVPPMHSALKHEGKALYEYARAGIEIERSARR